MSGGMFSSIPRKKSSGKAYVPSSLVLGPSLPEASGLRVSVLPLADLTPPLCIWFLYLSHPWLTWRFLLQLWVWREGRGTGERQSSTGRHTDARRPVQAETGWAPSLQGWS